MAAEPMTPLDEAHAAMTSSATDDAARLRYYAILADTELFVVLEHEAQANTIAPRVFDLEDGRFALAFDSEERLASCTGAVVPFAALPGRVLARELSDRNIGLGINLGVPAPTMMLAAEALVWLTGTLAARPNAGQGRIVAYRRPADLPQALLSALGQSLGRFAGLATRAHLVGVTYEGGAIGHLLVIEGADAAIETAMAKAVSEALIFSGIEAGALDVTFRADGDRALTLPFASALRFDLPPPVAADSSPVRPVAPGTDPTRPPKLR